MHYNHDDWTVSRNLSNDIAVFGFLAMLAGGFLQSSAHEPMTVSISASLSMVGGFFVFVTFLKVRTSPYSSRSGARVSETELSSIPESLLIASTLYGLANIVIYLSQTFSFVGTDVWTFLNTPVTTIGWLLFEGFLSFISVLARGNVQGKFRES
jgi:hypothetical protein